MKIYLASRYSRRRELAEYAQQLRAAGHIVTSRWLTGQHESADNDTSRWGDFAIDDLEDINKADVLVLFTESELVSRNSRMVELGIAIQIARVRIMRVIIIGPRENVFCCLPEVLMYDSWQQFVSRWVESSEMLHGVGNG